MTPAEESRFSQDLISLHPFAKAFALKLVNHNRAEAEDFCQEAFTKAWANRHQYHPGTNLKAWLFTIMRNAIYSEKRRSWRMVATDFTIQADGRDSDGLVEPQDWSLFAKEVKKELPKILTSEQLQSLLLVSFGWSHEETAKHLGVCIGTVKSRVARSRKILSEVTGFDVVRTYGKHTNRKQKQRILREKRAAQKAA